MGHTKDLYRDFALAFWKIARDDLGRAQDAMEKKAFSYVASRYPFIKDGKVVTPSEDFTEIEASIALTRAKSVFNEITSLLKKEYLLEIID